MKRTNSAAQAGFTLIELIVVIVILGILAATALPKFVSFGSDARYASIIAAKGALSTAASMVKGKWVVEGGKNANVAIEGSTVTYVAGNGYPLADAGFVAAAGLGSGDYTVYGPAAVTGSSTQPAVMAGQLVIVPNSIAGTATAIACNLSYTPPAASTSNAPTITTPTVSTSC